jgi:N-acetylglucosaminylphosphatidylinositol deacetylase
MSWPMSNALVVVAHPDDESMFFVPLILFLIKHQVSVHVLCLSTGNYDGLGKIRQKEMVSACRSLGVPEGQCTVLDDEAHFADGPKRRWDPEEVYKAVEDHIDDISGRSGSAMDGIFTFDQYGVSGHINHISVHSGVRLYLVRHPRTVGYFLESTNILRKYWGIIDVAVSYLLAVLSPQTSSRAPASSRTDSTGSTLSGASSSSSFLATTSSTSQPTTSPALQSKLPSTLVVTNFNYGINYTAMKKHASQFVWFRRLFVLLSSYSVVNTFRKF